MKSKIIFSIVSVLLLGLLAFGLFAPGSSAQAAAAQKTPNPWQQTLAPMRATLAALPTQQPADLGALLAREQLALSNQKVRLGVAQNIAQAAQLFIDSQKSAGKDTTALQTALAIFNQDIQAAQAANTSAASLLPSPAGFDASGKVTDRPTARQTLRSAGQSLRLAHLDLKNGTTTLRKAMRAFMSK
jgi:hypothetical protein